MIWRTSHRADPAAAALADRHYSRQTIGSPQFVPPGRCLVLVAGVGAEALWVTSWPFAEYTKHRWAGAWVCSLFRREGDLLPKSSDMIRQAVSATRSAWDPPPLGIVTFVDRAKVRPVMRRGAPTWGRTWELAGFSHVGETVGGLMAWQMLPSDMPPAAPAIGAQLGLLR